jgi:hypothetical protein
MTRPAPAGRGGFFKISENHPEFLYYSGKGRFPRIFLSGEKIKVGKEFAITGFMFPTNQPPLSPLVENLPFLCFECR